MLDSQERRRVTPGEREYRRVIGGLLVQDRDNESEDRSVMQVASAEAPSEAQWGDLLFAWRVAKHVHSNAIVLARGLTTVGVGAGQQSRVDASRLAVEKAVTAVGGAVCASDAFFPFADSIVRAARRRRQRVHPARRQRARRRGHRRGRRLRVP